MQRFYRARRDSIWLAWLGVVFAFSLSLIFMIIGVFQDDGNYEAFQAVFGLVGLAVFVLCFRGAWGLISGVKTRILSIDDEGLTWGAVGKENRILFDEVESIVLSDDDGEIFYVNLKGKTLSKSLIGGPSLSKKDLAKIWVLFQEHFPAIPCFVDLSPKAQALVEVLESERRLL